MPRLKNAVTGVVVSVSDELADRLDSEWVDVDKKAPAKKAAPAARKTAAKKTAAPAKNAAEAPADDASQGE